MSIPKLRVSPGRKRRRRSHLGLTGVQTTSCPNCGAARRPHSACRTCGYVRPGLQVRTSEGE